MRALLFHAKDWSYKITGFSNRPKGIKPEKVDKKLLSTKNCILVFITVESKDNEIEISGEISKEIKQMYKELRAKRVFILPFAHLSNDLASSSKSVKFFDLLEKHLKDYNCVRGHFGSDKSFKLEIFGEKGNVRFRDL